MAEILSEGFLDKAQEIAAKFCQQTTEVVRIAGQDKFRKMNEVALAEIPVSPCVSCWRKDWCCHECGEFTSYTRDGKQVPGFQQLQVAERNGKVKHIKI